MIRRMGSVLLAFLFILGYSVLLYGQEPYSDYYYLNELAIAVPVPEDMYYLARNMPEDDPFLKLLGRTSENNQETFIEHETYFQLYDLNVSYVINFDMTDSGFKDTKDLNETEMNAFMGSMTVEYGVSRVSDMSVYQTAEAVFLKFSVLFTSDITHHEIFYITIYQGKKIEIQLYTKDKAATEQQKTLADSVVNGIHFGMYEQIFGADSSYAEISSKMNNVTSYPAASSMASSVTSTDAFIYTDYNADTSFTVPANWSRDFSVKKSRYTQAVFYSNENSDAVIEYGSEDEWLTEFYMLRDGTTRADINNDYFSVEEIAEMFDLAASQVNIKYVDELKYFEFIYERDSYNIYNMIMYHNGIFYWFAFYGEADSRYYNDFLSLIKSVKYPAVSVPESSESPPVSIGSEDEGLSVTALRSFNSKNEGLYIAITAVFFALPILIYRYGVRRRPVESKRAMKIILIYGAVSLAALAAAAVFLKGSWAAVGVVLIWHITCYSILTGGQKQARHSDSVINVPAETRCQPVPPAQRQQTTASSEMGTTGSLKQPQFCEICGSKLKERSRYCPKCGAAVTPLSGGGM